MARRGGGAPFLVQIWTRPNLLNLRALPPLYGGAAGVGSEGWQEVKEAAAWSIFALSFQLPLVCSGT